MQEVLSLPTYQIEYLLLSYFVSVLGSFAALSSAATVRDDNGAIDQTSLFVAALALGGVAIWSMHFVGMLAYRLPVMVGYSKLETVVSLIAPVAVAWAALRFLAGGEMTFWRLAITGTLTGLGVCVMHYLGMYSMRFSGFFAWSAELLAASVAIAIVAASAALWLAFNKKTNVPKQVVAAMVMGVAVCAMHYTGMAAGAPMCRVDSSFVPTGLWLKADLIVIVPLCAMAISCIVIFNRVFRRVSMSFEFAK